MRMLLPRCVPIGGYTGNAGIIEMDDGTDHVTQFQLECESLNNALTTRRDNGEYGRNSLAKCWKLVQKMSGIHPK